VRRRSTPSSPSRSAIPELAAALRDLPPRRRLFVFLRYFADLSYAEIAEACGVSEGTVGAALAQSRSDLAQTLDPERRRR
jgi:RNA polymerase sigma factor (sigma-70 family)